MKSAFKITMYRSINPGHHREGDQTVREASRQQKTAARSSTVLLGYDKVSEPPTQVRPHTNKRSPRSTAPSVILFSRSMETSAILNDGSERTILLHSAAQELGLQGQREDLALRRIQQDIRTVPGRSVSFTVSSAIHPQKLMGSTEHSQQQSLASPNTHILLTLCRRLIVTSEISPSLIQSRTTAAAHRRLSPSPHSG